MEISYLYQLFLECGTICTDTRNIVEGSLFFALKGESFNGNQFACEALDKGCRYAIVDEKQFVSSERIHFVDDSLVTLQQLARYHRQRLNIPIIGITGSNGKTTTKELLKAVLSAKYNVYATKGNLNNHIGVPLSLLSIEKNIEIGIIEMGANHIGEIKILSEIAEPNYGIITNVGKAHIEGFGSFEGIKKGKGELYDFLSKNGGRIIFNAENIHLNEMLKNKSCEKIPYGRGEEMVINGIDYTVNPFLSVKLKIKGNKESLTVQTRLVGDYNFENVLAAFTFGYLFKVSPEEMKKSVEQYVPSNNRSQLIKTSKNKVLVDCYNANPDSMKVAIENFITLKDEQKVIILGDMLELGDHSKEEHAKIIELISSFTGNLKSYLVGDIFSNINKNKEIICFLTVEDLVNHLRKNNIKGAFVLLKGSRKLKLERLIDEL
ncbi:MAG: UDP-N-acetylmuramoyl-tripeptide--D-alanyl-D-alanine ligase [bacterium]